MTDPPGGRDTGPVAETRRIDAIDVLRGVALLGILLMNVQSFAMPQAAYFNPTVYGDLEGANLYAWVAGRMLADQKFMTIFSITATASAGSSPWIVSGRSAWWPRSGRCSSSPRRSGCAGSASGRPNGLGDGSRMGCARRCGERRCRSPSGESAPNPVLLCLPRTRQV